ncbi:MAG: hypothetical protein V7607_1663 [Solirubrobacteraceae bacterium]
MIVPETSSPMSAAAVPKAASATVPARRPRTTAAGSRVGGRAAARSAFEDERDQHADADLSAGGEEAVKRRACERGGVGAGRAGGAEHSERQRHDGGEDGPRQQRGRILQQADQCDEVGDDLYSHGGLLLGLARGAAQCPRTTIGRGPPACCECSAGPAHGRSLTRPAPSTSSARSTSMSSTSGIRLAPGPTWP